MKEIDYECIIEIVTETADDIYLLIVIRFPNTIEANCARNRNAFTVFKKNKCLGICNLTGDRDANSPYFVITIRPRIRFRYISNSSINSDMDANFYQVTATAARKQPSNGCNSKNETVCDMQSDKYCFTSGVVCDGIKNCGVSDWYDERKSECETPSEHIGYAPVVAVVAVIICVVLAASHCMLRYLPMAANSFFIFNANEDNRLCIDTVFKHPDYPQDNIDNIKKTSIIPVSSSSNEDSMDQQVVNNETIDVTLKKIELQSPPETKRIGHVCCSEHRLLSRKYAQKRSLHGEQGSGQLQCRPGCDC
ncbi:unnamed protein product [Diatraea saccharalis]|uniref:Uncharacterized protein n=1 Tax=Diatraea saccharalis TaxID=40085 RepID=A0A9N9QPD0_9NEOP|nr:unnamed protein product [Diatraea saccharalis]